MSDVEPKGRVLARVIRTFVRFEVTFKCATCPYSARKKVAQFLKMNLKCPRCGSPLERVKYLSSQAEIDALQQFEKLISSPGKQAPEVLSEMS